MIFETVQDHPEITEGLKTVGENVLTDQFSPEGLDSEVSASNMFLPLCSLSHENVSLDDVHCQLSEKKK